MRRELLHIDIPADILDIRDLFEAAGHKLFLVGGSVRDALLKKTPKDFDLATDATPDVVEDILKNFRTLGTGKAFGVINVFTKTGDFEIATFREDIGVGRRPDAVKFTTIEIDVMRRDLTINALFYDLSTQEVVDLVGGIDDLINGVVRTVGSPFERFNEDPLRKFRAIRFAARFGVDLSPETSQAILDNNSLEGVSKERIHEEFQKGVSSAKSVIFFMELLKKYDLFGQVFPGLDICQRFVETRNIPVLLCQLFKFEQTGKVRSILEECKFFKEVDQTVFLHTFSSQLAIDNAFKLKKAENVINDPKKLESKPDSGIHREDMEEIAEVFSLDNKMVTAFLEFKLTVTGTQLLAEGLKGVEIGKETFRRETENFRAILEKI